ncbi:MAG: hypothetical protein U5K36_01690 [Roseovarius sp.]|nr:hypothetical protein [Roseovarius sp.]
MVRLLWQRETEGARFDSPERRAALDKALRDKIALIRDPSLRRHYGAGDQGTALAAVQPRAEPAPARAPARRGAGGARRGPPPATPMPATKSSLLVSAGAGGAEHAARGGDPGRAGLHARR